MVNIEQNWINCDIETEVPTFSLWRARAAKADSGNTGARSINCSFNGSSAQLDSRKFSFSRTSRALAGLGAAKTSMWWPPQDTYTSEDTM